MKGRKKTKVMKLALLTDKEREGRSSSESEGNEVLYENGIQAF